MLGIIRAAAPRLAMSSAERLQADSIQAVCDSMQAAQDSIQAVQDSLKAAQDSLKAVQDSIKAAQDSLKAVQVARQKARDSVQAVPAPRRGVYDFVPHRILSVRSYSEAFPDSQSLQIVSAQKWGVTPVTNRQEAEERKSELVYVSSNPYFFVEPLYWSIPYLVPRASALLQDIGRNFIDSLYVKGLPAHKIIVTSVLRTKEEVARMRRYNGNVSENSCHMYGTTFDIAYNRYLRVEDTFLSYNKENTVSDVRLKQVLAEVLRDLRAEGRCWVKYEVKQSCFHATVR